MTGPTFEKTLPKALIQAENLPSLPAVAMEVLRLCENEASTVKDLAAAVQKDPALVVKMLKLANSSLFSLGHPVATLDHAAMVLGMKTVKLMSLSFSLAQTLPKEGQPGFDYEGYWRRSLVTAVAARSLANRAGAGAQDEAFLAGMLSHVGQLVLAECLPDLYLDLVAAQAPRWPTLEAEQVSLGFHSADVAAALLASWNLPELISVPVTYGNEMERIPEETPEEARELARLLGVATAVASVICEENNAQPLVNLELRAAEIELEGPALEGFLLGIEREITEAADMLALDLPAGESHAEILARARARILDISIDTSANLADARRRADDLAEENRELAVKATTDKLTGLSNRASFDEFLDLQIEARRTSNVPRALGLIMLDIDHFKRFNDTYGHQAGDAVLAKVGEALRGVLRKSDFTARYGGEEFAIVLPQTTPTNIRMVANRIRSAIERVKVDHDGEELSVTASLGGVCIARADSKRDALLLVKIADKLLYLAKENGRNRVEVYSKACLSTGREVEE